MHIQLLVGPVCSSIAMPDPQALSSARIRSKVGEPMHPFFFRCKSLRKDQYRSLMMFSKSVTYQLLKTLCLMSYHIRFTGTIQYLPKYLMQ